MLAAAFIAKSAFCIEHEYGDDAVAHAYLNEMLDQANNYSAAKGAAFFQELSKGQYPRATVVTCSDSRVHSNILDETPEGDMFMVRNIGNQLVNSKGSVQYGVNHLGSSLLLFIGHSRCGAITAASGDTSALESDVKKELDSLNIAKGGSNIEGVKTNVHNQVVAAMQEWAHQVQEGRLMVVGAVYDFADDMKQGQGKLNVININGKIY